MGAEQLYVTAMRMYVVSYIKNRVTVTFFSLLGKRVLSDAWALDTAQKPYVWQRLNPEGDRPSARM